MICHCGHSDTKHAANGCHALGCQCIRMRAPITPDWRAYRDPLSVPVPPCAVCGKPVPDAYAMLADATRFCSAACYEQWVRR
jgi:hypothetical protein